MPRRISVTPVAIHTSAVSLRRGPPCWVSLVVEQCLWTAISAVLSLNGLKWSRLAGGGAGRMTRSSDRARELASAARDIVDSETPRHIALVADHMAAHRSVPSGTILEGQQSGFVRAMVVAAEIEPAVAAAPARGRMVIVIGERIVG